MSMWGIPNASEILHSGTTLDLGPLEGGRITLFASIVYMIQDRDFDSNVDTDDILSLLAEWEAEYCTDTPSTFHMRESYALKTQSHDPDTPIYMEALSGENPEE